MVTDEQDERNVWMEALEAIHTNDTNRIRSLVSKGLDVNSISPMTNLTLLRTAAFFDSSSEIVELLLELGADGNAVGPDGNALTMANGYRNIKILLDHGTNPNIPQNHPPYGTALLVHAEKGDLDIVKLLIDHGADIYAGWNRLEFGYHNAFSSALSMGHFNIINLLLETLQKKAEQNDINWSELDWLNTAIRHGDKTLIERVFSIVEKNKESVNAALGTALDIKDYNLAKKLLNHGATPDEYAVNEAVLDGDWVRVKFLLKNGGKIRVENLPEAARNGDMKAVTFLLKHGANIDEIGSDGCTALLEAVANGHLDLVRILLKKGASANIVNDIVKYSKTPLMTALWQIYENRYDGNAAKIYLQIIETLLKSDADPHLIVESHDSEGWLYKQSAYELVHVAENYENEVKRLFDKYSKRKKNKWTLLRIFKKQK